MYYNSITTITTEEGAGGGGSNENDIDNGEFAIITEWPVLVSAIGCVLSKKRRRRRRRPRCPQPHQHHKSGGDRGEGLAKECWRRK